MIYILTGNIRTGKTTALFEWSENRNDVDGLLCPDDEEGKRYFLEIYSQNEFPLEVDADSILDRENLIQVGPFNFLKTAFSKANDYLIESSKNKEFKYLIIDELGKLELINEGLHDSAAELIKPSEFNQNNHLILVVRSTLLDEIILKYQISNYTLINKLELKNID